MYCLCNASYSEVMRIQRRNIVDRSEIDETCCQGCCMSYCCYQCSLIQMLVHLQKDPGYEEIPTADLDSDKDSEKPSTAFDIPALASHMIL